MSCFSIVATTSSRDASSDTVNGSGRHDFTDLAAPLVNEVGGFPAGSKQEFQPSRPPALRTDFGAANEIAFRNDADQLPGCVNHRKAADVLCEHRVRGIDDGRIRADRNDPPGHDLVSAHVEAPSVRIKRFNATASSSKMA
jgi:hypothetical protein